MRSSTLCSGANIIVVIVDRFFAISNVSTNLGALTSSSRARTLAKMKSKSECVMLAIRNVGNILLNMMNSISSSENLMTVAKIKSLVRLNHSTVQSLLASQRMKNSLRSVP